MFSKIILPPSTSLENKTGSWRIGKKVVFLHKNCNGCRLCYLFCPEGCIFGDKKFYDVDLTYCKGCMICVNVCPQKDIEIVEEV